MKKLLVGFMAAFMIFAVAGNASATFEKGNTILTAWVGATDNEVGIDLGNINTMLNLTNHELYAAGTTFGLGDFTTITDLSQVKFGAYSATNDYHWTFALNAPLENVQMYLNGFTSFDAAVNSTGGLYNENDVNGIGKIASSDRRSYFATMGYLGNYSTLNNPQQDFGNSSIDLTQGYVDMYLYEFVLGGTGVVPFVGPDASTQYKAVLRVAADGSVTLNPTVPVPSAATIMAFGLIALVGLKRRNA